MPTNTPDNDPASLSGVSTTPKISRPKRKFMGPFAVKTKRLLIVILENLPLHVLDNLNREAVDTDKGTDRNAGSN